MFVGVAGKLEGTREEPEYDVQAVHRSFRCLLRKYILYIVIPARLNLYPISLPLTHSREPFSFLFPFLFLGLSFFRGGWLGGGFSMYKMYGWYYECIECTK